MFYLKRYICFLCEDGKKLLLEDLILPTEPDLVS